jgi:hypothetical protein
VLAGPTGSRSPMRDGTDGDKYKPLPLARLLSEVLRGRARGCGARVVARQPGPVGLPENGDAAEVVGDEHQALTPRARAGGPREQPPSRSVNATGNTVPAPVAAGTGVGPPRARTGPAPYRRGRTPCDVSRAGCGRAAAGGAWSASSTGRVWVGRRSRSASAVSGSTGSPAAGGWGWSACACRRPICWSMRSWLRQASASCCAYLTGGRAVRGRRCARRARPAVARPGGRPAGGGSRCGARAGARARGCSRAAGRAAAWPAVRLGRRPGSRAARIASAMLICFDLLERIKPATTARAIPRRTAPPASPVTG